MRKLALTIAVLLLAGLSTRPVAAQSVTINGTTYQLPLQITINAAGSPTPTATATATDTPTPTLTATGTPTLTPTPSATPTVGAAFVITNPTAGQTVSGIINVTVNTARTGSCADQTTVWWLGLQIDGVNAGADDKSIALDTTKYKNGSHRLTVNGWDCGVTGGPSTTIIYTQSININVSNAAPSPTPTPSVTPSPLVTVTPTHFMTLPPNAPLPSGQSCAALVHAAPLPERIVANQAANAPPNSIPSYFYAWAGVGELNTADFAGVDGNFVGSTEDIFRWAACKWGIDEELVRDQAWQESFWRQSQVGDIDSPPGCNPGLPVTPITPGGQFCALLDLANADAGFPDKGHQWDSWGVLQTKVYYAWHTWPMIKDSTSFGTDYRYAEMRGCMNGDQIGYFQSQTPNNSADYLAAVSAAQSNPSGKSPNAGQTNLQRLAYGCIETHYSGSWNGGKDPFDYLTPVLSYATTKPWLKAAGQRKYNLKPRPDPHRAMLERMFKLHQPRRRK